MVGLIQKILFDLIESTVGADAVVEVKRRSGVPADKHFHMNKVYGDDEWQRLLASTCEVLNVTQAQAEEAYADYFCKDALNRWPMWFEMVQTGREFLEQHPVIHNGFATGVQDAEARAAINDKFRLECLKNELVVHYCSPNKLCGLYIALARWIINHYGDDARIEEVECLKKGDQECQIRIAWSQNGNGQ